MERSTSRTITTHAGSLARPADLVEMVRAREAGEPYDEQAFRERVRSAVAEAVRKQTEAGVDVVSDGEAGKPGFANYVKDRMTGLTTRLRTERRGFADQADFPDFQNPETGNLNAWRVVCAGPIVWSGPAAVETDIANFKAALEGQQVTEAFMPAASPGILSQNVTNEYYATDGEFLYAVAEALRNEYRAIVDAGLLLQIDSPDLAMGRVAQFAIKSVEEFRRVVGLRVWMC